MEGSSARQRCRNYSRPSSHPNDSWVVLAETSTYSLVGYQWGRGRRAVAMRFARVLRFFWLLRTAQLRNTVTMAQHPRNPEHLAALQDELRCLLNRWDPIGVYDESLDLPADEYDCLRGPLLTRLANHDSRADLSEYLWHEIEDHFGLDPLQSGTDAFTDRLLAWYAAKNQGA
jgi:hypothetical protein